MSFSSFSAVFILAATKFLFGPVAAIQVYYFTFWETILVLILGGVVGVTIFYFFGELFFLSVAKWRHARDEKKKAKGIMVIRKKFTPFNRRVIRIKHRFGIMGLAFLTPCIISIPIGSVIIARFYHHRSALKVLSTLYLWVVIWAFILTYFNDFIGNLFR